MRRESALPGTAVVLSLLVALLIPVVTIVGLFAPGFYRDSAWAIPQERGQDLITLAVVEPLLIVAMLAAWRAGGVAWRLLWAGALGYTAYTYLLYSYTTYFNALFLAYVALFSASAFAIGSLLIRLDLSALADSSAGGGRGARVVAAFLLFVGLFFAFAWLAQIIPATAQGTVPSSITQAKTPSNGVFIQDLGVAIPLLLLAGIWLWQGRAWGVALGGVLLVVTSVMAAAITAMSLFMAGAHVSGSSGQAWPFAALTAVSVGVTALHYRGLFAPRARTPVTLAPTVLHRRRAG